MAPSGLAQAPALLGCARCENVRRVLWRVEEHERLTERVWDITRVRDCVGKVRAEAESALSDGVWPVHPRDGEDGRRPLTTLYLGSAGVVWALHRLGSTIRLEAVVERALERYRAEPDFADEAHPPSLWMGEAGLLVVAALVGSAATDQVRLRELIRHNQTHPTWELMWGSPGSILAAKACGLEEEWRSAAVPLWECWDAATDLWTQNLYGRVAQRLGPAHGFAGNAHALRGFTTDGRLRERIGRALEATALREGELVNWPPSATPLDGIDFPIRVQWCHGAPGIVATLGDLMPQELAEAAAELVWRAGPLAKGPSLCHGTAGNGYAFLKMLEVTGDERWLERARAFAMHSIEQIEREHSAVGHGRYTLWTGDVGTALYLNACIEGDAAFPTIDFW